VTKTGTDARGGSLRRPARDETSGWTLSFRYISTARAGDTGLTEIRAAIRNQPKIRLKYLFREIDQRVGIDAADLPLLSVSIHRGVVPRAEMTDRESRADEFSGYKRVARGDIVINRMRAFEGGAGISSYDGMVSADYAVLRTGEHLDPRFFHHLIRSRWFVGEMTARLRGIGSAELGNVRTPRINVEALGDIFVAPPPIAEQRAMADYLDAETSRIDEMIDLKGHSLKLGVESFEAHRAQMILHGLDPVTGEGQLPDGWRSPMLGVLLELHRGVDLPTDSRGEGNIPVVSSGGISGFHSTAACEGPGVVTGRYGTVGEVFYVDGPYWPLNTTLYVSDFRRNYPKWVYHLLSTMPLEIDAEKSAVTGINRNVVGRLRAVQPSYAEQQWIAEELDQRHADVERTVAILNRQIDLLIERRQALISAAVTGQIEIPGVAA